MNNQEVGMRIKTARIESGMTLAEVAERVHVAPSTIQRYERGSFESIKLSVIQAIAEAVHANPSWIVGKSEDRTVPQSNALTEDEENLLELYRGLPEESRMLVTSFLKMHSELALHSSSKKGKSTHREFTEQSDEPGPVRTTLFYQ